METLFSLVTAECDPGLPGRAALRRAKRRWSGLTAPGVATGLVWTPMGGDISSSRPPRRRSPLNRPSTLTITGQLGDVMKESRAGRALRTFALMPRSRSGSDFLQHDIHIHVPAGAIPKDGPSRRHHDVTALASLFKRADGSRSSLAHDGRGDALRAACCRSAYQGEGAGRRGGRDQDDRPRAGAEPQGRSGGPAGRGAQPAAFHLGRAGRGRHRKRA